MKAKLYLLWIAVWLMAGVAVTPATEAVGSAKSHAAPDAILHLMPRHEWLEARHPVLSDNGRYILYEYASLPSHYFAPNLRYYDTQTGTLTDLLRVYEGPYRRGAMPQLSPDGRFSTFVGCFRDFPEGESDSCPHAYRHDHQNGETVLLSQSTAGLLADAPTYFPSLTADGNWIAFASEATNLVADDGNGASDIFLRDVAAGTTTRVSMGMNGAEANGGSYRPTISDNGRFIVFESDASNLVAGDTNSNCINGATTIGMTCRDVFVYEVATATLERVSVATGGVEGNGTSFAASISEDGTLVMFSSSSINLVPGDINGNAPVCNPPTTNYTQCYDVFLRQRTTGETHRISVDENGNEWTGTASGGVLSPDGTVAVFYATVPELKPDCPSCTVIVRLELATGQLIVIEDDLYMGQERGTFAFEDAGGGAVYQGTMRLGITPSGQQIGFTGVTLAYRTCDIESTYCREAVIWDAAHQAYVTPLPACSGPDWRPSTATSTIQNGGDYHVYLPMTRIACRPGRP